MSFGGAVADSYGNARIAFQASGSITRTDFGLQTSWHGAIIPG